MRRNPRANSGVSHSRMVGFRFPQPRGKSRAMDYNPRCHQLDASVSAEDLRGLRTWYPVGPKQAAALLVLTTPNLAGSALRESFCFRCPGSLDDSTREGTKSKQDYFIFRKLFPIRRLRDRNYILDSTLRCACAIRGDIISSWTTEYSNFGSSEQKIPGWGPESSICWAIVLLLSYPGVHSRETGCGLSALKAASCIVTR